MILLQSGMLTAAAFFFCAMLPVAGPVPKKNGPEWLRNTGARELHWHLCLRRLLLQLGPSQPKEMPLAADFLHRQEAG